MTIKELKILSLFIITNKAIKVDNLRKVVFEKDFCFEFLQVLEKFIRDDLFKNMPKDY
jgi:hypothetical protein